MQVKNYEEQVYAGVLGKVVGVYMGRPFEGWDNDRIEAKWGTVDHYVHEDQDVPLVVSDDDITGTFTFVRAMEDSGLYGDVTAEAFGEAWLNYVIENKTVFWWGGAGTSTEHTAYLRLKQGYKAPRSGSSELNGRVVAEQIGGQIFIDAMGLVAPGRPELAAELARRHASVSHDGEAIHGAVVVAAMISAAFVEKDMSKLLDIGISQIPNDSIIAHVHRDVRAWCKNDGDWRETRRRICAEYGPDKYWGGPHVVPNHALMVMAWAYAPDDFQASQAIVNTAGWDTDCNAGNVGAVMGVKLGLAGVNARYDFQAPMADRMLLPTAEGTRSTSDCLTEAMRIAAIGRRVMGWEQVPPPRDGAVHTFHMPGALHGWMSEDNRFETRGAAEVRNVPFGENRAMRIAFTDVSRGRPARVSTPMLPDAGTKEIYSTIATPKLYPGQTVTVIAKVGADLTGPAQARLFLRHRAIDEGLSALTRSAPIEMASGQAVELYLEVPQADRPVAELGIEITGRNRVCGELLVDRVIFAGTPHITFPDQLPLAANGEPAGWISSMRTVSHSNFVTKDGPPMTEFTRDEGTGVLVTGTRDWTDYAFAADVNIHLADRAGLVCRYQGLRRYVALVWAGGKLQLVREYHGRKILAEKVVDWPCDSWHRLALNCSGNTITAFLDGENVLETQSGMLTCGGTGFLCEFGRAGFRNAQLRTENS